MVAGANPAAVAVGVAAMVRGVPSPSFWERKVVDVDNQAEAVVVDMGDPGVDRVVDMGAPGVDKAVDMVPVEVLNLEDMDLLVGLKVEDMVPLEVLNLVDTAQLEVDKAPLEGVPVTESNQEETQNT